MMLATKNSYVIVCYTSQNYRSIAKNSMKVMHIKIVLHFTMKTLFAGQYWWKINDNSIIIFWSISFLVTIPFKL
jgi:hypothetical protein